MSKYKTTAFTRLFVFLLILLPILYIVSSYINGEDGLENIKSIFGKEGTIEEQILEKNKKIDKLEKQIKDLRTEIKTLENQ